VIVMYCESCFSVNIKRTPLEDFIDYECLECGAVYLEGQGWVDEIWLLCNCLSKGHLDKPETSQGENDEHKN
jgi:hypothetical protein